MRYTTLGRTGLRVSRVGLGCGGPSRLGQSYGQSRDASQRVIQRALDLGINFFDTAQTYDTETIVGQALAGVRDDVIISTKKGVYNGESKTLCTPAEMREGIDLSLRALGRERIEVFHLHGLALEHVDYALSAILPVLDEAKAQGKIGFTAVSEAFMADTDHRMLRRVLDANVFDVMMIGFNLLNPSARHTVLPKTQALNVGTLMMFAVRRALSRPDRLLEVIDSMIGAGVIDGDALPPGDHPLGFLGDVRDAAYRFCAHEPGADVVLTGTGSPQHLDENVRSLLADPLPDDQLKRLGELFGHIDGVSAH
jgi:aryl-alcohol dehydrogenase-like predicted oxidoreductase